MNNPIDALTEARPSSTHGLGLFAKVPIPRGTVWWRAPIEDVFTVSQRQFELLTASAQSAGRDAVITALLEHGYYLKRLDAILYICDVARYTNHSFMPNSVVSPDSDGLSSVAITEIAAGQEITENYTSFDRCPWAKLYGEFGRKIGYWSDAQWDAGRK